MRSDECDFIKEKKEVQVFRQGSAVWAYNTNMVLGAFLEWPLALV